MLPKGVGVAKYDFTQTFRNQLLSRVRVLYHQYSMTNYSEIILKSKVMSILMIIIFVVFSFSFALLFFLSHLLRNILKCNCSPYSTLMKCINLVQYYAAMYYNHSSMLKVHLVSGQVVYVHLIDTVYVQNNLSTEFSKRTIFII